MGRLLLVGRLALRDLQRRKAEAVLLLVAIMAATITLTLGLVVRDAADDPYGKTRAVTHGPDVVAVGPADNGLAGAAGVVASSGPFPVAPAKLVTSSGRSSDVQIEGRDTAPAPVDQPSVTRGSWVRDGGVVLEAAFAQELGLRVGDAVSVGGRAFDVVGLAVTAAMAPYPAPSCWVTGGCATGVSPDTALPPGVLRSPGLIWLTRAGALSLATDPVYLTNLRLADPSAAPAFIDAHLGTVAAQKPGRIGIGRPSLFLQSWPEIQANATRLAQDSQILLLIGAWLLGLLAVAGLSVLVGGRMADQARRVGLLKAVGGTPELVAAVLLAEYLLVALVAAAAGLVVGALTAPLLVGETAGLLGAARPAMTWPTIGLVTAVALVVAVVATFVPALRAARVSTVRSLADAPRPPRRVGWLIRWSARLPVPLLLALRLAVRRPRRVVLAVASIAVTVSGIYVLLILNRFLSGDGPYDAAQVRVLRHVLLLWTVVLLALAAVNAIVIAWATVLDNRHSSALARALGATPGEVTAALAAAQALPALAGAVLGVPVGWGFFAVLMVITGGDSGGAARPSVGELAAVVLAIVVAVAGLTAVPARIGRSALP
jgi:putative ABC transport system permease protein